MVGGSNVKVAVVKSEADKAAEPRRFDPTLSLTCSAGTGESRHARDALRGLHMVSTEKASSDKGT
jgi:hypothetical protein